MIGECVTNVVRYDRYMRKRIPLCLDLDDLAFEDFTMKEMADRIALPLESGGLGAEDRTVEHKTHEEHLASGAALQRIVTEDNQTKYASGQSVQMRCYICRIRDVTCRCARKTAVTNRCATRVAL